MTNSKFESCIVHHVFHTLKMPLAEKPVASSISGLFEGRKNAYRSKDAKASFYGVYKTRTLNLPSLTKYLKEKRRSAVPLLTGLQDGAFFIFHRKGDEHGKRSKQQGSSCARELSPAHAP